MNTAKIIKELIICLLLLLSIFFIQAQPKYYGGHHSSSHDSTHLTFSGPSHKGDHRQDSSTYDRYGVHAARRKK